jgi:hypothetical protein
VEVAVANRQLYFTAVVLEVIAQGIVDGEDRFFPGRFIRLFERIRSWVDELHGSKFVVFAHFRVAACLEALEVRGGFQEAAAIPTEQLAVDEPDAGAREQGLDLR